MTVRELIESLSKVEDKEIRVMVRGYEGGVNDMIIGNGIEDNTPAIQYVALDVNDEWYYGRHERVDDMYDVTSSKYHIVKAIILQARDPFRYPIRYPFDTRFCPGLIPVYTYVSHKEDNWRDIERTTEKHSKR